MPKQGHQPAPSSPSLFQRLPFFYGWVILAVASLAMFVSGPGQTYTLSIFVDPISEDLRLSRTLISSLYSSATLVGAVGMVLIGWLIDRYGARVVLTTVSIAFGIAVGSIRFVDNPLQLFLGLLALRFLGQGALTLIPTTLVALWFTRLRARAMIIPVVGSGISQGVFPPLAHLLITRLDWRRTWTVLGLVVWGLLVLPAFFLVRRSPESVGTVPDGKVQSSASQQGSPTSSAANSSTLDWSLKQVLRLRSFWLLLFVASATSLVQTGLVFHQVSLLGERGIDSGVAAVALGMMAPAVLAGAVSTGFLADALPNRFIMIGTNGLVAVALASYLTLSSDWQAIANGLVLGLAGGSHMTVSSVIWANYYGKSHLGSIRGVAFLSSVGASAFSPLPLGILHDLTDNYTLPLRLMLAVSLTAAFAAIFAKPPHGD